MPWKEERREGLLILVQVFASHAQFKDWFSNPLTGMVEGQEAVNKVLLFGPLLLAFRRPKRISAPALI